MAPTKKWVWNEGPQATLPPPEQAPPPIKDRLYTYSLQPYKQDTKRRIDLTCEECKKVFKDKTWPLNTTNLRAHYKKKHPEVILSTDSDYPTSSNTSIIIDNSNTLDTINSYSEPSSSTSNTIEKGQRLLTEGYKSNVLVVKQPTLLKRKSIGDFAITEFTRLVLNFIITNNLPFSIVNSPSFRQLCYYLHKEYFTIPSRQTIRREFSLYYLDNIAGFKRILNKNSSCFSITLDEWKAGNNIDFLAITLHYINNKFKLVNYLIGFESLRNEDTYTGEVLFKYFDRVLEGLSIRNRLLGITRDNAGPCNKLVKVISKEYKKAYNIRIIDIKCAAHIINLSSNVFLTYVFFIINSTAKFNKTLEDINMKNREFANKNLKWMKLLPNTLRTIVKLVKYNHFFKNNFARLVANEKAEKGTKEGPEKLISDNDTRWLSKLNLLERLLLFRNIINRLLYNASKLRPAQQKALKLDKFNISNTEIEYMQEVKDILELFREPTIIFQARDYETITWTIPTIGSLIRDLDIKLSYEYNRSNPYIKAGLEAARDKLLEYYPIRDSTTKNELTNKTLLFEKLKDLLVITVLNPKLKLSIFRHSTLNFSTDLEIDLRVYLKSIYNTYKQEYIANNPYKVIFNESQGTIGSNLDSSSQRPISLKDDFLEEPNDIAIEEDELDAYLKEPRLNKDSQLSLEAYYISKEQIWPIMFTIARDYLAIASSSVPSESEFSKATEVVTNKRNKLLPETISQIMILKALDKMPTDKDIYISSLQGIDTSKEPPIILDDNINSKDDPIILEDFPYTKSKGKQRQEENSTTSLSNSFLDDSLSTNVIQDNIDLSDIEIGLNSSNVSNDEEEDNNSEELDFDNMDISEAE